MVIFHSFLYAYQRVKNLIHWSTMIHCWGLIISFQSNYIGDSEAMVDYVGFAGWSSRWGSWHIIFEPNDQQHESIIWKQPGGLKGALKGGAFPLFSWVITWHVETCKVRPSSWPVWASGMWAWKLVRGFRLAKILLLGCWCWAKSSDNLWSAWVKLRLRTLFCRVPVSWKMLSFIVQHHLKSGLDGLSWVGNPQETLLS